ncbi:unnamed protein product [Somion occarium]|uniref:BTB domain-containing protein n=1 Tax=Somion occarium TaxID=3059160 RepID=A0ABP1DSF1_9APHY
MDATLNGSNPMFADEAADIALLSKDNMTFRMCSNVLWTTSGWFRTLLTLPQAATRTESVDQSPIHLDEPSDVVTGLFETISGIGLPKLDTLEYAEALLNAAEKYDMPGPPAIIRKLVTQPPLILQPLRVYAIAVHWGWHEEIKIATSHTLTLDLCNPDILKQVQGSSLSATSFSRLLAIHHTRRTSIQRCLTDNGVFTANSSPPCRKCQASNSHEAWRTFKITCMQEAESRPFGEKLTISDILERPRGLFLWSTPLSGPNDPGSTRNDA